MALGRRVNDVGLTAWEHALATELVVDAQLSGSSARHMESIVTGPWSSEAVNGQLAVPLLIICSNICSYWVKNVCSYGVKNGISILYNVCMGTKRRGRPWFKPCFG